MDLLQQHLFALVDGYLAHRPEAMSELDAIKRSASAGDPGASRLWDGVRHAFWSRESTQADMERAQDLYDRAVAGDAEAIGIVDELHRRAELGDSFAVAERGRLRTVAGYARPDALFPAGPGAPRFGGYGLPALHRAGIVAGAPRRARDGR